ncbi:MAG: hypothetical protein KJO70_08870 [Gammaproteobacteria bacterium]|nr:hypothetical protein [Gammaproteobacteria bacterium]NNJ77626.1 hypothetical protein [Xanthomonadales bacterium]
MEGKKPTDKAGDESGRPDAVADKGDEQPARPRNGGWQQIEALRERAALKASLADVWDEDFDLDEEILAELDHNAEFFTTEEGDEVEDIPDDDDAGDFYDADDDV